MQVFHAISEDQAVLVVFPGCEAQFGPAYEAMTEGGLTVKQIVWDKVYCGGTTGARMNYSTENILIGYTTPEVRLEEYSSFTQSFFKRSLFSSGYHA